MYLLPIFLSIIVISSDVLDSVTTSYSLTNNYFGKISAKYLCEIGLKHGIKSSREGLSNEEYYINLIDNTISTSNKIEGDEYTKVNITRKTYLEKIIVTIDSVSYVGKFSKSLIHEYTIILKPKEKNIDNKSENLDTNGNSSIT